LNAALPGAQRLAGHRPAQPGTNWGEQGIKKENFAGKRENRFNKRFLLLQAIATDDPGVDDTGGAIGGVTLPPLVKLQGRALKFYRLLLATGMAHKDIGNAIRAGQTLFQRDGCLG